jgi:hypothetical protein
MTRELLKIASRSHAPRSSGQIEAVGNQGKRRQFRTTATAERQISRPMHTQLLKSVGTKHYPVACAVSGWIRYQLGKLMFCLDVFCPGRM